MPEFRNRQELEARIRTLEQENGLLAENVEHTLMLGLVSEAIGKIDNIAEMLDVVLERISMLKAIPFVACCALDVHRATVIHSYLSFSHADVDGYQFQINDDHDEPLFINAEGISASLLQFAGWLHC